MTYDMNKYSISRPLFTWSNSSQTFSNFFGEGKEFERKLHSFVLLT